MQRQLIKWWRANCHLFNVPECLLFSIPNGGHRTAVTASIMKAEGARKGAPDLVLAARTYDRTPPGTCGHKAGAAGLFLELKRPAGIVSPEQLAFHEALRAQGYEVWIVRQLGTAIDIITNYLKP